MKTSVPAPPPAPAPVDPGKSALDYTKAMADPVLQAQLLQSEQTYRPEYNALNLQDINQYLLGTGGQKGALEQMDYASKASAQTQSAANTIQRQADIADVQNLGQSAAAAFRAANPELQAALARAQTLGTTSNPFAPFEQRVNAMGSQIGAGGVPLDQLGGSLYNQALGASGLGQVGQKLQDRASQLAGSTGQLTAEELRNLQQSVRGAYAARGTEMGSGAVSAEALARLSNERQRQAEDLQMAAALNQGSQQEINANREFASAINQANRGWQQQSLGNYALLGQMNQANTAADRAYQLQLLQAQAATTFDPMNAILGRSSNALNFAQGQQGFAGNLTQSMQGPQLFDPNAGINLALQQNANLGNYQSSVYGARAAAAGAAAQGQGAMIGGIAGGIGSLAGGAAGAAAITLF